jgi:hypothetical protein
MASAQEEQVVKGCRSTIDPMLYVIGLIEASQAIRRALSEFSRPV